MNKNEWMPEKEMRNSQIENAEKGEDGRQRTNKTKEIKKNNCLVEQQISIVTWLVMYNLSVQFAY